MPKEQHYGNPEEDGIWPDPEPAEDLQQNPENPDVVIGSDLPIVMGIPYRRKTGVVGVNDEERELPPEVAQTAQKMGRGLDGLLHAKPAKPDEWGGGLEVINKPEAQAQTDEKLPRSHSKSSLKRPDLT